MNPCSQVGATGLGISLKSTSWPYPYRPFVIVARVPGADDVAGLDGCLFRAAAFVFLDPGRPRLPEVRGLQIAGIALI